MADCPLASQQLRDNILCHLPGLAQERILSHCSSADLAAIRCCSRECRQMIDRTVTRLFPWIVIASSAWDTAAASYGASSKFTGGDDAQRISLPAGQVEATGDVLASADGVSSAIPPVTFPGVNKTLIACSTTSNEGTLGLADSSPYRFLTELVLRDHPHRDCCLDPSSASYGGDIFRPPQHFNPFQDISMDELHLPVRLRGAARSGSGDGRQSSDTGGEMVVGPVSVGFECLAAMPSLTSLSACMACVADLRTAREAACDYLNRVLRAQSKSAVAGHVPKGSWPQAAGAAGGLVAGEAAGGGTAGTVPQRVPRRAAWLAQQHEIRMRQDRQSVLELLTKAYMDEQLVTAVRQLPALASRLTQLTLTEVPFGSPVFEAVAACTSLTRLVLSMRASRAFVTASVTAVQPTNATFFTSDEAAMRCEQQPVHLEALARGLPRLQHLDLHISAFPAKLDFGVLAALTGLTYLQLNQRASYENTLGSRFEPLPSEYVPHPLLAPLHGIEAVASLPQLHSLSLIGLDCPPSELLAALALPGEAGGPLRRLWLHNMYRLTGTHLGLLGALTSLTELQLSVCWCLPLGSDSLTPTEVAVLDGNEGDEEEEEDLELEMEVAPEPLLAGWPEGAADSKGAGLADVGPAGGGGVGVGGGAAVHAGVGPASMDPFQTGVIGALQHHHHHHHHPGCQRPEQLLMHHMHDFLHNLQRYDELELLRFRQQQHQRQLGPLGDALIIPPVMVQLPPLFWGPGGAGPGGDAGGDAFGGIGGGLALGGGGGGAGNRAVMHADDRLAPFRRLQNLQVLHLGIGRIVGVATMGRRFLTHLSAMTSLTRISLRYRSVDMRLLAVLAPLPHLVHLTLRYWNGRRIGRKTATDLSMWCNLSAVTNLDFGALEAHQDRDIIRRVLPRTQLGAVGVFGLVGCQPHYDVFAALAEITSLTSLTVEGSWMLPGSHLRQSSATFPQRLSELRRLTLLRNLILGCGGSGGDCGLMDSGGELTSLEGVWGMNGDLDVSPPSPPVGPLEVPPLRGIPPLQPTAPLEDPPPAMLRPLPVLAETQPLQLEPEEYGEERVAVSERVRFLFEESDREDRGQGPTAAAEAAINSAAAGPSRPVPSMGHSGGCASQAIPGRLPRNHEDSAAVAETTLSAMTPRGHHPKYAACRGDGTSALPPGDDLGATDAVGDDALHSPSDSVRPPPCSDNGFVGHVPSVASSREGLVRTGSTSGSKLKSSASTGRKRSSNAVLEAQPDSQDQTPHSKVKAKQLKAANEKAAEAVEEEAAVTMLPPLPSGLSPSSRWLLQLSELTQLTGLRLEHWRTVPPPALAPLVALRRLQLIGLSRLEESLLKVLSALPALTYLTLEGKSAAHAGFYGVPACVHMAYIIGPSISALGALTRLRMLVLSGFSLVSNRQCLKAWEQPHPAGEVGVRRGDVGSSCDAAASSTSADASAEAPGSNPAVVLPAAATAVAGVDSPRSSMLVRCPHCSHYICDCGRDGAKHYPEGSEGTVYQLVGSLGRMKALRYLSLCIPEFYKAPHVTALCNELPGLRILNLPADIIQQSLSSSVLVTRGLSIRQQLQMPLPEPDRPFPEKLEGLTAAVYAGLDEGEFGAVVEGLDAEIRAEGALLTIGNPVDGDGVAVGASRRRG